jgi:type VI secretion system ImpC/EvpB family protein
MPPVPASNPETFTQSLEAPAPPRSLLESLLDLKPSAAPSAAPRAPLQDALAAAQSALEAIRLSRSRGATTCATPVACHNAREALTAIFGELHGLTLQDLARQLHAITARIEDALDTQVNAIIHHRRFQRLEASWRGLHYLWERSREAAERAEELNERAEIKIRLLCASKQDLLKDARDAVEFDQSALFKKVYESEFGMAGGEPFNLLVGDYEFCEINRQSSLPGEREEFTAETARKRRDYSDDLETLTSIAGVAAAAFAPFITAASPEFFGLNDFRRLEVGLPLEQDFQGPDFIKWQAFRNSPDARFVGLAMPRVLMREPYHLEPTRGDAFRFTEDVAEEGGHSKYLWGNAAYAWASVVMRAYAETGWFADIRGFERSTDIDRGQTGGLVKGLAMDSFTTDRPGVALKTNTDVVLGSDDEQSLSQLGFIPLCACPGTRYSVFYSNASVHIPRKLDDAAATTTERMSSMLQYVLCASRFAHYLKSLSRQQIGSFAAAETLTTKLRTWIARYVADDPTAKPEIKAQYPLLKAEISVEEIPGTAGAYQMNMQLLPHYQLDALAASLKLVHRLPGGS